MEFILNSKANHLLSILSFYTSTSKVTPRNVNFKFFPYANSERHTLVINTLSLLLWPMSSSSFLIKPPSVGKCEATTQRKWHGEHPWQLECHFRWPTRIRPYAMLLFPQSSCLHILFQKTNTQTCAPNRQNKIFSLYRRPWLFMWQQIPKSLDLIQNKHLDTRWAFLMSYSCCHTWGQDEQLTGALLSSSWILFTD